MRFSIAIPVYGQADFLPTALESIRAQAQYVQVAVMDATPDNSVQNVLKKYLDLLFYRRHGPDSGQAAAIQEGWDITDGDIIAWLCADDYYFPYTIEAVRTIFINNPDIDIVYGDTVFIDENGCFLGYFPSIGDDLSNLSSQCCISQPSCFVRRTAFEKIGGKLNSDLHYIMDWDLWTRLYQGGAKFHYLNKPLSVARMYEGTKTSSRSYRRFLEIGRHVFLNASLIATIRSLVGFYYQDLLSAKATGLERLLLSALNFFHNQKHRFQDLSYGNRCIKYGLVPYSNLVIGAADVYLPWYSQNEPVFIHVLCDQQTAPVLHLNGKELLANSGFANNFFYEIPNTNISAHLLHIKLSAADIPWSLHSVNLHSDEIG